MKQLRFLLPALFFNCWLVHTAAQTHPGSSTESFPSVSARHLSPGGLLDTLFDQSGKKYSLSDLQIRPVQAARTANTGTNPIQPQSVVTFTGCNSGYFKL